MSNYLLIIWTKEGQAHQFIGATEELTLLALRKWMNGSNGESDPFRADGLTCRDCPAPHDVVLSWDKHEGKWYISWGGSAWSSSRTEHRRPLRTPDDWKAAVSRSTSRRCFKDWGEARQAFLDACACRVTSLDAKVSCADCEREMVRAYTPYIPMVGHVCYDCLTYYIGRPTFLPEPVVEAANA